MPIVLNMSSKKTASTAGKVLKNPKSSKKAKSLAGSVLAQRKKPAAKKPVKAN